MLRVAWSEIYAHPLPEGHRFPMQKYRLIPEQLLYEGTLSEDNFFLPQKADKEDILAVHSLAYFNKLVDKTLSKQEERKIGFPLSTRLVDREMIIAGGTIQVALFALSHGISLNVAGGTHHAYADSGEGFCLFNDIAIAASYLIRNRLAKKILVIDLDVHQGNGTAKIFENDPNVFTFSMHGKNNYPARKEKSDLDIDLADHVDDEVYLDILLHRLPQLMEQVSPDFVFYQSGVDVLKTDKLGKLDMSREGCKERDRLVFKTCVDHQIPVAVTMGGGYSEKLSDIVEAHCNTFRLAQTFVVE
jgi:acetoin utilization deacetylase AcuC-like enzyme